MDRIFAALDGVKPREAVEILIAALAVTTLVGKDPNAPIEEIGRTVGEAFLLELRTRDQKLNSGVAH